MKKYTKEELNEIGVYNLRNYARSLGVVSPTTKNKKELIQEIFLIYNGVFINDMPQNKGRPPKLKMFNDVSILVRELKTKSTKEELSSKLIEIMLNSSTILQDIETLKNLEKKLVELCEKIRNIINYLKVK